MAFEKSCTEDVKCHVPQLLLQLNIKKIYAFFLHLIVVFLRKVFGQTGFNETFFLQIHLNKFIHFSTLGVVMRVGLPCIGPPRVWFANYRSDWSFPRKECELISLTRPAYEVTHGPAG